MNSPPQSNLRHFIFWSDSFSTKALKALNFSNVSSLCFSKPIQHILEKSSMNKMKYSSPRGEFFLVGPHKSVWMSSIGLIVGPSFSLKWTLVFLRTWHGLQMVFLGWWYLEDHELAWAYLLFLFEKSLDALTFCAITSFHLFFLDRIVFVLLLVYRLLGVLVPLITVFPVSSSQTTHPFDRNTNSFPWSHIWLTLNKLCFKPAHTWHFHL